jgi:hypothetical protein
MTVGFCGNTHAKMQHLLMIPSSISRQFRRKLTAQQQAEQNEVQQDKSYHNVHQQLALIINKMNHHHHSPDEGSHLMWNQDKVEITLKAF